MANLLRDARFGLRLFRKNPGFAAVAVLTLALGIGANTAIFSVVYATYLDPLPYRDAERLYVAVALTLLGAALVACLVPARRAASVDPMIALRQE